MIDYKPEATLYKHKYTGQMVLIGDLESKPVKYMRTANAVQHAESFDTDHLELVAHTTYSEGIGHVVPSMINPVVKRKQRYEN